MFKFRFSTATDKIMIGLAFLSATVTGVVAPINTIVFSNLTQAMIFYAIQDEHPEAGVPEDFDFQHEIFLFAIRNVIMGVVLLVFSYLSTMFSNFTAHNQVQYIYLKIVFRSVLLQNF